MPQGTPQLLQSKHSKSSLLLSHKVWLVKSFLHCLQPTWQELIRPEPSTSGATINFKIYWWVLRSPFFKYLMEQAELVNNCERRTFWHGCLFRPSARPQLQTRPTDSWLNCWKRITSMKQT